MGERALVETDILYALMDVSDAHHKTALKIFDLVKQKKLNICVIPLSLLELELLIKAVTFLLTVRKHQSRQQSCGSTIYVLL